MENGDRVRFVCLSDCVELPVSSDCWCWAQDCDHVPVLLHRAPGNGRCRLVTARRARRRQCAWGHQVPPRNKTTSCGRALIGGLDVAGDGAQRVSHPGGHLGGTGGAAPCVRSAADPEWRAIRPPGLLRSAASFLPKLTRVPGHVGQTLRLTRAPAALDTLHACLARSLVPGKPPAQGGYDHRTSGPSSEASAGSGPSRSHASLGRKGGRSSRLPGCLGTWVTIGTIVTQTWLKQRASSPGGTSLFARSTGSWLVAASHWLPQPSHHRPSSLARSLLQLGGGTEGTAHTLATATTHAVDHRPPIAIVRCTFMRSSAALPPSLVYAARRQLAGLWYRR